ncbi:MAG: VWA domain-containing protein, partial [Pseudomonadota bacterium]
DDLLTDPPPDAPADPGETPPLGPDDLQDLAIAAASAARPEIFKHEARQDRQRGALTSPGKSGTLKDKARRGRPIGHTPSPPFPDARPDALATLHAAAPWQKLRRGTLPTESNAGEAQRAPLAIRKSDFRFTRFKQHTESVAIFVVDASGSTALQRLGEAKGAIELLLSECYVRRDQVALVTFRGDAASLALGPTRSLVRAKRTIGGLPGGGATPLASALSEAYQLAEQARRAGQSPLVVLMTDGNGNVALDGSRDRAGALEDTKRMARHFVASGLDAIIIDIGRRPREAARALANDLKADYCTLPRVDAASVSSLVSHYLQAS